MSAKNLGMTRTAYKKYVESLTYEFFLNCGMFKEWKQMGAYIRLRSAAKILLEEYPVFSKRSKNKLFTANGIDTEEIQNIAAETKPKLSSEDNRILEMLR